MAQQKASQKTHETMQIYGEFEGFPLFNSASFELVYDTMTPCLGQLCPKEEELLPVATFGWSPSRLEGGGGWRNFHCKNGKPWGQMRPAIFQSSK